MLLLVVGAMIFRYTQSEVKNVPKYEEIANVLRDRIRSKKYPPNSFLPNQVDLVEEFNASRMTIKKAINILAMEGLVYSQRGSGTKILSHPYLNKDTSPANEYEGLSLQMKRRQRSLTSQIIQFDVEFPNPFIQERLMIDAEQPVYNIHRLRILDDEPYILEHTFMPVQLVPGLKKEHLLSSIYDYLHKELNVHFAGAYRAISADKSSAFDQQYLNCAETDPVLEVQQVVYLKDGQPIEYSSSRNRFDVRNYSLLDVRGNQ
ncbi:GntR family transcriptional regulator [Enterococcus mundtii]|uniref:GntR family transcriptional regulator n=1 Tax=Enterococcus mundtii TaxID=53346 RepID=A0A2S7RSP5_ENTMU|nr:GntR family transcriptional regulator [Enterococcus mundtii]PQF22681.1 GntR family transcriptional regulator [Enterococcus mundtii]PTO39528.1 GntR family transcriptional regulator [Enterococcus mundtii]PTO43866.1 GntR family transcriptional regulator [Enterococcus mundtii]